MYCIPFVGAIFVVLVILRRRGMLTFGITALAGTFGMFIVFFTNGISNGQQVVEAFLSAAVFSSLLGGGLFGLLKLLGIDDRTG